MKSTKIKKILVANRGEIAIRINRACIELGIPTVGIFSHEDRMSLHRYKADESYQIGAGLSPVKVYLDIDGIIEIAQRCGADAIHPGYGLLSENPDFPEACKKAGIIFIGPNADIVKNMGDKVAARKLAKQAKVPLIPGSKDAVNISAAKKWCRHYGLPAMIKASFGGGGRGMRIVNNMDELEELFFQAKQEADSAFGKDDLFLERFIKDAKHIEVQIIADNYGNVVHLYERDCSIQRRHQKIIEIAPCINIPLNQREKLCKYAIKLAKTIGYKNAGTVEFMVDKDWNIYFIEMNTRIQVEHTITEMITGIDIVKTQIRIAQGSSLKELGLYPQNRISMKGASIQCRVTTEDPENNFVPDHGRIELYKSPAGFGIRLDAGSAYEGAMITPFYDPLLVKVTAFSIEFKDTVNKMLRALKEFRIRGVKTNLPFLENLLNHETFKAGNCTTGFIDIHPELFDLSLHHDQIHLLLGYIAEINVNGNPIVKKTGNKKKFREIVIPEPCSKKVSEGTRDIFNRLGPEKFSKWIMEQKRLLITDTTFRDAHQSLLATKVRSYNLLKIAKRFGQDNPNLFSIEMWGGATFDVSMRFLKECPWERLASLRQRIPHILFQMLLRGSNAVGYTSYPDNVIKRFVKEAAEMGIDLFRIFDSLNWDKGMMVAIEAVRHQGKIAETAICYTGDILDKKRDKYSLKYYVKLAKRFEKMGANILAIKDMAGLCSPYAVSKLVSTLRQEVGIPIHFHTHDTAGIQAASILKASDAGVDIVDCAISSMSGLTSQPNLNSIVAALRNTPRHTELDVDVLNKYSHYWECVREFYYPFESGLLSSTAEVYDHEIPGGQYSNLWPQAQAMGLEDRWVELKKMYASVNKIMGDLVKVTPSSKAVGDMALYLLTNNINPEKIIEKAAEIDFPDSVIGFFKGDIGQPYGGFPEKLQKAVLKDQKPLKTRAGKRLAPVDFSKTKKQLEKKVEHQVKDYDVLSYILYPQVFLDFDAHRKKYGEVTILPTNIFLYGNEFTRDLLLELPEGKDVLIKYLGISELHDEGGTRDVFFEVNGEPLNIRVFDKNSGVKVKQNRKADPDNPCHVGCPMPGLIAEICVKIGDTVKKGDKIFTIEAMKMVTSAYSVMTGEVVNIEVEKGSCVESGDLLMELM